MSPYSYYAWSPLTLSQGAGGFTIDGVSYVSPQLPVLLQILSGVTAPQDLLPSGSVISLPANSVIELSLPGGTVSTSGPHPFHLHGVCNCALSDIPYNDSYSHSTRSALFVAPEAPNTTTTTPCAGTSSASEPVLRTTSPFALRYFTSFLNYLILC